MCEQDQWMLSQAWPRFSCFFLFFGSNDYYSVNSAGVEFLNFLSMLVIKSSIIIILWSIIVSILRIYFYT